MENNIQTKKVNPRSLSSILTICMLICLFVTFCLGMFTIMRTPSQQVAEVTQLKWELMWVNCGPYLAFMIVAFLLGIIKFFTCTVPLKKEYPSKDTIKFQFAMEVIGLIMLLIGCLSLTFLLGKIDIEDPTSNIGKYNTPIVIVQSLLLAIQVACGGLAYHNYK